MGSASGKARWKAKDRKPLPRILTQLPFGIAKYLEIPRGLSCCCNTERVPYIQCTELGRAAMRLRPMAVAGLATTAEGSYLQMHFLGVHLSHSCAPTAVSLLSHSP